MVDLVSGVQKARPGQGARVAWTRGTHFNYCFVFYLSNALAALVDRL